MIHTCQKFWNLSRRLPQLVAPTRSQYISLRQLHLSKSLPEGMLVFATDRLRLSDNITGIIPTEIDVFLLNITIFFIQSSSIQGKFHSEISHSELIKLWRLLDGCNQLNILP